MKRILLLGLNETALTATRLDRVRQLAPDMDLLQTRDRTTIESALNEIEIAVGSFPHDLVVSAPRLRWFQQWGAGADWLLRYPDVQERDVVVTNASGVHSVPISEHILAFLLAFARNLPQAIRAQEQHIWMSNRWQREHGTTLRNDAKLASFNNERNVFELADKTLLLIGVGAIGSRTAQIAAAMDMRVLGLRRHPQLSEPGVTAMVGPEQLLDVLPKADFVVITAPLTGETRHLIDGAALAAMKSSAYLINIGRGGTVDEVALIQALQSGQIAGAGLDVFATEPLPEDSPLWDMPNVIVTSHYSGLTPRYDERAFEIFIDNLERFQNGEPLRNVVDKQLGY